MNRKAFLLSAHFVLAIFFAMDARANINGSSIFGPGFESPVPLNDRTKPIGVDEPQVLARLSEHFVFTPFESLSGGLNNFTLRVGFNKNSEAQIGIFKHKDAVVLVAFTFPTATDPTEANIIRGSHRMGQLIRLLKNSVPDVPWDAKENSANLGKVIGQLSRVPGDITYNAGSRKVFFRRLSLEKPFEIYIYASP